MNNSIIFYLTMRKALNSKLLIKNTAQCQDKIGKMEIFGSGNNFQDRNLGNVGIMLGPKATFAQRQHKILKYSEYCFKTLKFQSYEAKKIFNVKICKKSKNLLFFNSVKPCGAWCQSLFQFQDKSLSVIIGTASSLSVGVETAYHTNKQKSTT